MNSGDSLTFKRTWQKQLQRSFGNTKGIRMVPRSPLPNVNVRINFGSWKTFLGKLVAPSTYRKLSVLHSNTIRSKWNAIPSYLRWLRKSMPATHLFAQHPIPLLFCSGGAAMLSEMSDILRAFSSCFHRAAAFHFCQFLL